MMCTTDIYNLFPSEAIHQRILLYYLSGKIPFDNYTIDYQCIYTPDCSEHKASIVATVRILNFVGKIFVV